MGKMATSPLPSRGSPPLQGRGAKLEVAHKSVYVTPAGIPSASERGAKSEVAHLWAKWLRYPCRLGDSTSPLQSGGQNQKWPTCEQNGYVIFAVSGIPTASERGAKSAVAHLWGKWLRHPCRLGDPHRFRAGGKIRRGPLVGKMATSPLPSRGSQPLRSGGSQNHKWPTCGQNGYVTCAVSGIPTDCRAGGKAKWPTYGQNGYVTAAVTRIPTASERGAKLEVAPQVGKMATSPLLSLGDPHRCRAEGQNQTWPTCAHKWAHF